MSNEPLIANLIHHADTKQLLTDAVESVMLATDNGKSTEVVDRTTKGKDEGKSPMSTITVTKRRYRAISRLQCGPPFVLRYGRDNTISGRFYRNHALLRQYRFFPFKFCDHSHDISHECDL